jgi:two-component system, sensor histidine kinase and response regulator
VVSGAPARILVVEDERIVAEDLAETLVALGYTVVGVATTGELAIERARQLVPDVVLMDIRLAGKLDGIDAVEQILAERDVAVVYLTAHSDDETLRRAKDTQPLGFLVKPFRSADLRCAIEIAVHKHRFDAQLRLRERWLETAYQELEMFSYAVAHDLRAPLRGIDGFSRALLEDHGDVLPADGLANLQRVRDATKRMARLIDDLLRLSQTANAPLERRTFDLSALATAVIDELRAVTPREVTVEIEPEMIVDGDPPLVRIVLENLLGNAWKFTRQHAAPAIHVGFGERGAERAIYIRDNGAGFDAARAERLFGAFQRFHSSVDFDGNGVGLAIVQRIINRHGGRIWVESAIGHGATFSFTL